MQRWVVCVLAGAALAVAGCGQSKEEKATSQVCSARADIKKQVDTLKNMTLSTATTSKISDSLGAIRDDLSQIKDAQGDLSDSRRASVKDANQQFASQVKSTASDLGSNLSLATAKQQVTTALNQLATSYQQTFARIDCSSS
jgi:hypothetical protein